MLLFNKKLFYIVEDADWVIYRNGKYITENLNNKFKLNSGLYNIGNLEGLRKIKNKILHFGSRSTYLPDNYKIVDSSNKVIFTWFHGMDSDKDFIQSLPRGSKKADIIHTACTVSKNNLARWGAEEEKIVIIPLGVDLKEFKKINEEEKLKIRQKLGIPEDMICIGSFQKDGIGWEEGLKPKLEKGPDIFCEVLGKIKKDFPVFVLLTGPARGYVKKRLEEMGIPYKHFYVEYYPDVSKYYGALDYYIVSSRVEGGPLAILECFASGVPFVTTRVGMVEDIIEDGLNSLVSEVEDTQGLAKNLIKIMQDRGLKERLVNNGLETVKNYDWSIISEKFYKNIYSKLL